MAGLKRLARLENGWDAASQPAAVLPSPRQSCQCLADFYREELLKHRLCLEMQREYYSESAIVQAEDAILRLLEQVEFLCQRADACELLGELLRQFDSVTHLSVWTETQGVH